ncbi:type I secretion system permease/ATPase [Aliiroseovarius sp. Z3]|uniref:type I secretion system permease/ATPase n=1 Tax=Aliiroseovarius sp. Z3 TaxID=2811402 RepID=UPI0023B22048|nr:type I secretion system permease/ATPase [Aliiroseovarius sp. Z3]
MTNAAKQVRDPETPSKPRLVLKTVDRVETKTQPSSKMDGAGMGVTIDQKANQPISNKSTPPPDRTGGGGGGNGGGGGGGASFHKRIGPQDFSQSLKEGMAAVRGNLLFVMVMTCATNILILSIPIYLFQISDRVLTSRSTDTLIMLTIVIAGAVILQAVFDAVRRFVLMRTAVEVAAKLGTPILSAAAAASLNGTGREYQTLGDLQQLRGFIVSGTLISFLDVPFAPLFILAIFLVHPQLGMIVVVTSLLLLVIALINQKATAKPFAEANLAQSKANMHLDSMSRNSQIINALAMIPEAVSIWGKDTAESLTAQVRAQDRNIISAAFSRGVRLLTQIGMLGWGAYLAIQGEITGGMVIAASIIAGRALAPIEGSIEGWNAFILTRGAYGRIRTLLQNSKLQFEKLRLPRPEGRLDVERLLFVPPGTKDVVLNGLSFQLNPGESLAIIGNSGAGKTTLGKMLVGSILPTSGNVRLDLMDLRNWEPRQFGESIGYLPQDVQLFPGSIKDNIGRMRADATDEQIYEAAKLADVHEMIANLPQGYETMVAADGSPLSGGQKQRIALARAFFGNPRMVVLDEPNSNLDAAGDKALARAIDHARRNKITVVVITQKPALLDVVDKIMLIRDGSIALFGTRDTVLQRIRDDQRARQQPPKPLGEQT